MPKTATINCGVHGAQRPTLVCQHIGESLHTRIPVGFHWSREDLSPWPDAWCTECNDNLVRHPEGEWTEEALQHASLKVLCSGCYEEAAILSFGTASWREQFAWALPGAS